MDKLLKLADKISLVGVWGAGASMVICAIIISVEIVLRKVFNASIGGADELAGYTLAVCTSWSLSFALLHRVNIRIDALYHILPKMVCAVLDICSLMAMGVVVTILTHFSFGVVMESFERNSLANTPLQTPLVIPQALWALGFVLFIVTVVLLTVRSLMALVTGDLSKINQLAGIRTIEEEVHDDVGMDMKSPVLVD